MRDEGDGGRGGEFIFFSNDNKVVLKTLTDLELNQFVRMFSYYYDHFMKN